MKKAISIVLVLALIFIMSTSIFALPIQTDRFENTVPRFMQPGTIIVYDSNSVPQIFAGGTMKTSTLSAKTAVTSCMDRLRLATIPEDASPEEIQMIELENQIAIEQYNNYVNGDYYRVSDPLISAGMRVEYDSVTGGINNIYLPDESSPSGYSLHGTETDYEGANAAVKATNATQWTWGAHNNTLTYQPTSDSFLGTGRATYYVGSMGNRNNTLQPYDCATKMSYDYSKVGDEDVRIRNLDTNQVFTYYQADVGGLPDAIIDIWEVANIRELAGTLPGQPTSNADNVRYFHYRFSDQAIPG